MEKFCAEAVKEGNFTGSYILNKKEQLTAEVLRNEGMEGAGEGVSVSDWRKPDGQDRSSAGKNWRRGSEC